MDVKAYLQTLSEAQWDAAEQIEAEIHATAVEGLTEENAVLFVQTVFAVRRVVPKASVARIYDMALRFGLPHVAALVVPEPEKSKPKAAKRKVRVTGVEGVGRGVRTYLGSRNG